MPEARLQRTRDANQELNSANWRERYYARAKQAEPHTGSPILYSQAEHFFLLSEAPEADRLEPTADTPWGV